MKNKTFAAWLAFLAGPLGLHRFYLHGLGDLLGWALPIPTALGVYGLQRVQALGQDDMLAWVLIPCLGFTFAGRGLAAVTQPVQLWQAGSDQILPAPEYVEPVRAALPNPPEFFRVEGAGHFDFMPPCSTELKLFAPAICAPTPGFDRAAFHETFGREVIRFFKAHLAASSPDAAPVRAGGLSPGTGPAS